MRISALPFLALSASLLGSTLVAQNSASTVEQNRKDLNTLFHDAWEETLKHDPEFASVIGDKRYNNQIDDYSVKAIHERLEREEAFMTRLAAIDPTGLSDQEKLSRDLLLRQFTEDQEAAKYKEWEMPLSQMDGIYNNYTQLVARLSFTSVKDYDDWIARLHAIPTAFDQVTANMALGIQDHRVPPRFLLEKAQEQIKNLGSQKPEDSPLALPLKNFPASIPTAERDRIQEEMLAAIGKEVLPAYLRLARFMEVSYIPAGRTEPGISSIPGGAGYYAYLLRHHTNTELTAEQIHQIGLNEVANDEAQMLTIAKKLGFQDLKSFQASLKTNPKLHPASADALLAAWREDLKPMQAALPQLFGRLPKAPFEVVPVPAYMEKTAAPAYYEAGTPDGSRPGRLFVDTYNATRRNLYQSEDVAYHEGVPGHHLQISIAQELQGLPEFRKFGSYTAYVEGWGLYAEFLGKDAGFYKDPYADYGRLEGDIWRAVRLVVDTGVHAQHWTRQQMVDYFHEHTALDEASIQSEVDRYIAWPGQATAYKIGQLSILMMRSQAEKALGAKFDLRAFHDQVLDSGALPLDLLSERIETWVNSQKAAQ